MDEFNYQARNILTPLHDPVVKGIISIFIILYGSLAAPALPQSIRKHMDNIFIRLLFYALIIWVGIADPVLSIILSLAFIMTVNVANSEKPFAGFEFFEGPSTAIYPGCMNITVFDLLESFKNDKEALLNSMMVARVPADVKLTDYFAPLIATYLLNKGFTLKAPCTPPGVDQRIGAWS